MTARERIAVVGAGVVGLACGASLVRRGHQVTLFDPEPPGSQTSYGNAALIATSFVVPLALPGFWRQVPGMLMDPLGPLALKWRHLPRMAPWLLRLVAASAPGRVEAIAATLAPLVARSLAVWLDLLGRDTPLLRHEGTLLVFRDPKRMRATEPEVELQRRHGVRVERLEPPAIAQMEPTLVRDLVGGFFYPDGSHCVDPLALSQALARDIQARGGTIEARRVVRLATDADGRPVVATSEGEARFDRAIVAAGIWSKALLAPLGVRVPLESERGYHLMLPNPGVELGRPVRSGDYRFMLVPLAGGLRLAGTAEFASLEAPPDWRRADVFMAPAKALLPRLDGHGAVRWMGHRPSTPDSLPAIGPLPGHPRIVAAFGHGHLGLTLGATTGVFVADLIAGRPDPALAKLGLDRFRRRLGAGTASR